jgi:type II secretion system protein N
VIKTAAAILTVFILFFGLWYIAFPEDLIVDILGNSVGGDMFYLKADGLRKGLLYDLDVDRMSLMKRDRRIAGGKAPEGGLAPLLVSEDVHIRLDFLSGLTLHPEIAFSGKLYGGKILGTSGLAGNSLLRVKGNNISVGGLPLLGNFGVKGDGLLSGEVISRKGKGELRFVADNLRLGSASLKDTILPLNLFHTVRGSLKLDGDTVNIESLTMSGDGVRGRLKGTIRGGFLDASLEVMTDSSSGQGSLFQAMLAPYKASPGYYVIPVRTALKGL